MHPKSYTKNVCFSSLPRQALLVDKSIGNTHLLENVVTVPQSTTWPVIVSVLLEPKNNLGVGASQRNMGAKQKELNEALVFKKVRRDPNGLGKHPGTPVHLILIPTQAVTVFSPSSGV